MQLTARNELLLAIMPRAYPLILAALLLVAVLSRATSGSSLDVSLESITPAKMKRLVSMSFHAFLGLFFDCSLSYTVTSQYTGMVNFRL